MPPATPIFTPAPPRDTAAPVPITGLVGANAYDGRVSLRWDRSAASDFLHYKVYASKSEIRDVTGIVSVAQIANIGSNSYQVVGLDNGRKYYFAVTAVDRNGNENKQVASVAAIPAPMPRGRVDRDLQLDIYRPDLAWPGTTLLPDNFDPARPRIMEVNMLGEIVWEYVIPDELKLYSNPGFDVELLPNNNILFLRPKKGVYEIDRSGRIVWSYLDSKVSHDADRLPNGNTLIAWGEDSLSDAQVKEVNPQGQVVWAWYAKDHFYRPPYKDIYDGGWTHTNAVTRMSNGHTLISPRNFNLLIEVDPKGSVVRTIGEGILFRNHDPAVLPSGNILVANPGLIPNRAVEIDPSTGGILWQSPAFPLRNSPVRDANRLPNGNTLITGSSAIVEVTPDGEIAWQLRLGGAFWSEPRDPAAAGRGFYKAERVDDNRAIGM